MTALTFSLGLAGCGSSHHAHHRAPTYGPGITGTLPAAGHPARGGTITVGQLTAQAPQEILPIIDDASCTAATINFIDNQYIPLYAGPVGNRPAVNHALSAAEPPFYSHGDTVVTIRLKGGLKWSDGTAVTSTDVIFALDLLRAAVKASPANWCQYSPGELPSDVTSWTATGPRTVVLHLARAVNPDWFTANQLQDVGAGIYPLPSQDWNVDATDGEHITDWATNPQDALRIYQYLHAEGTDRSAFLQSTLWKIVDGPFKLADFSAGTGAYELVPNAAYSLRPKPRVAAISVHSYPSPGAMLAALESHSLDIAPIDPLTQLGAIRRLRRSGYDVFGGPGWGWFGAILNFKDRTDDFSNVIAQPYIRGVLAELVNQRRIIRQVYGGWAVPAAGPIPQGIRSPYLQPALARGGWPFNPQQAVATLKAHGWHVRPGGRTTCARAGTAKGDCGAGIPAGTPIRFVWANVSSSVSPIDTRESRIIVQEAMRAAGIDISLISRPFNVLTTQFNDQNASAARFVNDWGANNIGGVYTDFYPTAEGLLSAGGSLNLGGYADPAADRAMSASVSTAGTAAINQEVAYLRRSYPVLYLPDQDLITAVRSTIGGPANAFRAMTQQQYLFSALYTISRTRSSH